MQFGVNKHKLVFQRRLKLQRQLGASEICSLWNIYNLQKIGWEIKFLLINSLHEKKPSQEVKADSMSVLLCTYVTWKRHLFLANQKPLSFSYIVTIYNIYTNWPPTWMAKEIGRSQGRDGSYGQLLKLWPYCSWQLTSLHCDSRKILTVNFFKPLPVKICWCLHLGIVV